MAEVQAFVFRVHVLPLEHHFSFNLPSYSLTTTSPSQSPCSPVWILLGLEPRDTVQNITNQRILSATSSPANTKRAESGTMRTRHSLPASHDDDDGFSIPIDEETGEAPKWAKELLIDGKDTLRGDKKAKKDLGFYTWRGAVYAIDENTPQEWIDAEADRRKKEKAPSVFRHKSETPASVPRFSNLKSKQRESVTVVEERGGLITEEAAPRPAKKTKRVGEEEETTALPEKKKPRKRLGSLQQDRSLKNRPSDGHYLFANLNKKEKKAKKPKVPKPNVEERGSLSGAQVDRAEVVPQSHPVQQYDTFTPSAHLPNMPESFSIPITDQDKQTLSRIISNVTEPEANVLASTIVEIGKINSGARRQQARSEGLINALKDIKEQLLAKQRREKDVVGEKSNSNYQDSVMGQETHTLTSPTIENNQAAGGSGTWWGNRMGTMGTPSLSHSAQSELDFAPSPTSQEMNPLLPSLNRGGQALRYSLTTEKLQAALDGYSTVNTGQVIDRSRLEGESQSAKRRRIKRELAILENLPRLLDQYPAGNGVSRN